MVHPKAYVRERVLEMQFQRFCQLRLDDFGWLLPIAPHDLRHALANQGFSVQRGRFKCVSPYVLPSFLLILFFRLIIYPS